MFPFDSDMLEKYIKDKSVNKTWSIESFGKGIKDSVKWYPIMKIE